MAALTVQGSPTKEPLVTFKKPYTTKATTTQVITKGNGAQVSAGDEVTVDYEGVNGTNDSIFDTSWGKKPASFLVSPTQVIPGFAKGLTGQTVGSRVAVAIPPQDGYGAQGQPQAGIKGTDTLVFVMDIKAAKKVPTKANGTPVKPKAGLPTVKVASNGVATITTPKGKKAPTTLVTQVLLQGKGATIKPNQSVTLGFTETKWGATKNLTSTYSKGGSQQVPLAQGTIPGLVKGLTGQKVGSRVMLILPPSQGFGTQGQPQAGIKGTDTLVFVIDILATK